jgi:hypothetical protein
MQSCVVTGHRFTSVIPKKIMDDDEEEEEDSSSYEMEDQESHNDGEDEADVEEQFLSEYDDGDEQDDYESDDDESDDDDDGTALRHQFKFQCEKIKTNRAEFTEFDSFLRLNDSRALQLGRALIGNTCLSLLTIWLGRRLTVKGTLALMAGVIGSQVKRLSLRKHDGELPILQMDVMAPIYRHAFETVDSIYWDFPLDDQHANRLGQCLTRRQTKLQRLGVVVDHMTTLGAQTLATAIRDSRLESLRLVQRKSGDDALTLNAMQTLFLQGVHGSATIQSLLLYKSLGDFNVLLTDLVPILRELDLEGVSLSLVQTQMLSDALMTEPSAVTRDLEKLCLYRCGLNDEHARILALCLGTHRSLQELDLQNNQIGDAGITSFVEHWRNDSVLRILNISRNCIGPVGVLRLVQALSNHTNVMEMLNVDHNNSRMGYDDLKLLGQALAGKKLAKLNLHNNVADNIWIAFADDTCKDATSQAAKRTQAGKALVEGVQNNLYLTSLLIPGMRLPIPVSEQLEFYLQANRSGRSLLLEQHTLPLAIWSHFLARQPPPRGNRNSLLFLFLRELPLLMTTTTTAGQR